MEKEQIIHDLAIAYAQTKLHEHQIDMRESIANGYVESSMSEIVNLKGYYDFAIKNLSTLL